MNTLYINFYAKAHLCESKNESTTLKILNVNSFDPLGFVIKTEWAMNMGETVF